MREGVDNITVMNNRIDIGDGTVELRLVPVVNAVFVTQVTEECGIGHHRIRFVDAGGIGELQ